MVNNYPRGIRPRMVPRVNDLSHDALSVTDLTGKNFGLLIAYIVPGFVALWAFRPFSPDIAGWLTPSPWLPAGLEAMFFITLSSTAAGLGVSAARWLLIDTFHHWTGLTRPVWDDAKLPSREEAFDLIVEAHYRHYQFYANMAVALALLFLSWQINRVDTGGGQVLGPIVVFLVTEVLFIATSRDVLRKYYARTARLLPFPRRAERREPDGQRKRHSPKAKQAGRR